MERKRGYQSELWGTPTFKGQAEEKQPKQGCEKQEGTGAERHTLSDSSGVLERVGSDGVGECQGSLGTRHISQGRDHLLFPCHSRHSHQNRLLLH